MNKKCDEDSLYAFSAMNKNLMTVKRGIIQYYQIFQTHRRSFRAGRAYLFCSSSLASSSTSSGLSWAGVDGDRAGEESDVEEEVAVVCRDVGAATWLAIWLTVWDTELFTHERVALSLPETLSVATCGGRERSGRTEKMMWCLGEPEASDSSANL